MYTPEFSKPRVLSVSQLNFYIKSIIENDARLNFVFVTGEISNLTDHYRSGHIYLSIKDEKSVIRAVMFAGNARNLKFRPTDGMKVICRGRVAVYEPTGQYQLYIEDMQPDGIGALSLAYEQLKKSLAEKGLFAPEENSAVSEFNRCNYFSHRCGSSGYPQHSFKKISVCRHNYVSRTCSGRECSRPTY